MKHLTRIILSTAIILGSGVTLLHAVDATPPALPPLPPLGDMPTPSASATSNKTPDGMKELTLPPATTSKATSGSAISTSALAPLPMPTPGKDPFANIAPPSKSADAFPVPPLPSDEANVKKATPPIIVTAADTDKDADKDKTKKKHKHKNGKTKKVATHVEPRVSSTYFISEPLPEAIYKKSYDRLNRHLPVAYYESDYDTLMFVTAAHDDVNGLHSLLDNGRNVELIDTAGDTPLLVAVKSGALNTARILLAHRANPNVKDRSGMTPLQIATQKGNYPMQRALEEMGATACTQVSSAQ